MAGSAPVGGTNLIPGDGSADWAAAPRPQNWMTRPTAQGRRMGHPVLLFHRYTAMIASQTRPATTLLRRGPRVGFRRGFPRRRKRCGVRRHGQAFQEHEIPTFEWNAFGTADYWGRSESKW